MEHRAAARHGPRRLGTRDGKGFLIGGLDEVAIYPRLLSPEEIRRHYGVAPRAARPPSPSTRDAPPFFADDLRRAGQRGGKSDSILDVEQTPSVPGSSRLPLPRP